MVVCIKRHYVKKFADGKYKTFFTEVVCKKLDIPIEELLEMRDADFRRMLIKRGYGSKAPERMFIGYEVYSFGRIEIQGRSMPMYSFFPGYYDRTHQSGPKKGDKIRKPIFPYGLLRPPKKVPR